MKDQEPKTLNIYAVEEQELWRELYRSIFSPDNNANLLGATDHRDVKAIKEAIAAFNPDVLLIGTKSLNYEFIEEFKQISAEFPKTGIMLLFMKYNREGIELMKKLVADYEAGVAVFLRQSLERVEQLRQIIVSVSEGHFVLDPAFTRLLLTEKSQNHLLDGFTDREMEVLNLVALGYTNSAIAETLFIDIRTVRHHINNMYSKLRSDADFDKKHPRVNATRLYLETIGELLV